MHYIKITGLALFLAALALFIGLLFMSRYEVSDQGLAALSPQVKEPHRAFVDQSLRQLSGVDYGFKFTFLSHARGALKEANNSIILRYGLSEEALLPGVDKALAEAEEKDGQLIFTEASLEALKSLFPETSRKTVEDYSGWLTGRSFASPEEFKETVKNGLKNANEGVLGSYKISDYDRDEYLFFIAKTMAQGPYWQHKILFFLLIIGLGTIGALVYIFPAFFDGLPGIKHNGIYHRSATSRGLIGILTGGFLVGFYILLYFYPYYIVEWVSLVDPVSELLRGEPASRWFMYGLLYTLAILVMGIRMFAKYRHSRYHQIRTASVMFFQVAFAFLIPQILYQLNKPEVDLKNIWPLNYSFFFDWNIANHIDAGTVGIFMLVWGIILAFIGVPVLTYLYGKRWYCSWVCGCGGLAETLGDPYRQLSDKSLKAWQIERYLIHGVLAFALGMTGMVLYTYFSGSSTVLGLNSYSVRGLYGFAIGSIFAGVVGTGFYPVMGNRVWCRFGCPLAAYLGLVQRFKSRFRITTNGGQCISCGNCSTYCEMGIDVRWYAQRGQNIVRSSCVGCGVCAAVCPRGVLSLENGPEK